VRPASTPRCGGSVGPSTPGDATLIDRERLTDRQVEVVETAHEKGYVEYPRGTNAAEVAAEPNVHPSTVAEHLAAAQAKLLDRLFAE
jgi:predicted DNA binding protein